MDARLATDNLAPHPAVLFRPLPMPRTSTPWAFRWSEPDLSQQYLMHARFYGSSLGRFMKPDDGTAQTSVDPQSWNLYSYVRGNPVNLNDPTGHADPWVMDFKYSVPKQALQQAAATAAKAPVTTADKVMMVPVVGVGLLLGGAAIATLGPAAGVSVPAVKTALTTAGIGAVSGAISDKEQPARGMAIGAAGGLVGGALPTHPVTGALVGATQSLASQVVSGTGEIDPLKVTFAGAAGTLTSLGGLSVAGEFGGNSSIIAATAEGAFSSSMSMVPQESAGPPSAIVNRKDQDLVPPM